MLLVLCPLPQHDPGAGRLPATALNLLKFTQWVLWKCSACHELSGKAKHDTCTHRQRHLRTQTFLLDWGARLMVLEPTNWRMTAEQAACWDIGQSPWEPPELPGKRLAKPESS